MEGVNDIAHGNREDIGDENQGNDFMGGENESDGEASQDDNEDGHDDSFEMEGEGVRDGRGGGGFLGGIFS